MSLLLSIGLGGKKRRRIRGWKTWGWDLRDKKTVHCWRQRARGLGSKPLGLSPGLQFFVFVLTIYEGVNHTHTHPATSTCIYTLASKLKNPLSQFGTIYNKYSCNRKTSSCFTLQLNEFLWLS